MWGAANQPTSYATNYGFVPSAVVTATYTSSTGTYYISPVGSDSNNGTSVSTPWLTPNHAVNCGDTVTAAAGNYSSGQFPDLRYGDLPCRKQRGLAAVRNLRCLQDRDDHAGRDADPEELLGYQGMGGHNQ